jgi:hypothetical protein
MKKIAKRKNGETANAETKGIVRMGNMLCRILKNCKEVKQGKDWTMIVDGCTGDTLQIQDLTPPKNNKPFGEGFDLYWEGDNESDNPYDEEKEADARLSWEQGWRMAREYDNDEDD